jgi:hypothetical protein
MHGISAGIMVGSPLQNLVSSFEEHSARLEARIDLETWSGMDVDEKAMIIALRRINSAVKNLQEEAVIAKSEREKK